MATIVVQKIPQLYALDSMQRLRVSRMSRTWCLALVGALFNDLNQHTMGVFLLSLVTRVMTSCDG